MEDKLNDMYSLSLLEEHIEKLSVQEVCIVVGPWSSLVLGAHWAILFVVGEDEQTPAKARIIKVLGRAKQDYNKVLLSKTFLYYQL